jgi:hypothetical protein
MSQSDCLRRLKSKADKPPPALERYRWRITPMALYRLHFVDHGNNVRETRHIEHDSDDEAIEAAHRMNVSWIGAGFDVWEDERLVHRHRN